MKRILLIVFLLTLNVYTLAVNLGQLLPGSENAISLEISIKKVTPNEDHYAEIFTANFTQNDSIFIKTSDNRLVTSEPTPISVIKHDTSYELSLSCGPDVKPGEYQFTIYTYAINPHSDHKYKYSEQYVTYTFRIDSSLTLNEISLWSPPSTGEPWESKVISRHTIRITSNDDWELALKGIESCEGLHAVLIEKDPVIYRPPLDILVTENLTKILDGPMTLYRDNAEIIYAVLIYIDDYTIVPAGELDIQLYLEASITPHNMAVVSL